MDDTSRTQQSARFLFLVTALFWSAQYSYTQFINPELERMGMNAAYMGLVSGAYGLTQTLLRIPLGITADRLGRQQPFVILGCLLATLSCAGFLLFYSPAGFLLSRGLAGAASAAWVSFTVLYSAYFPHHEGPRRISHLNAANMMGRLAGFFLVLFIIPRLGLKSAFTLSLIAGAMAFLMSTRLAEAPHARQGIRLSRMLQVAKDPYLLACSVIGILTQALAFATYYGFTVNVAKGLGADGKLLTWLNIALLVPTLVMNYLVTGRLLKRYTGRQLATAGFLVGALYCALVPLARNLPQLFALQILGGTSSTLTFGVLIGQSVRDIPQHLRAVAMGVYQAVYGIGMTLGPILMGLMIDAGGLKTAFMAMAVFALLSALLAWRMLNISPRQTASPTQKGTP